jgi:hypothetical protein
LNTANLTPHQRLARVFRGESADRTPILSGWIACPEHLCAIVGVTLEEYWRNPIRASIAAYRSLRVDGLIDIFVPRHQDDFRCVDASSYLHATTALTLAEAVARIEAMPSAAQIEAAFDFETEYAAFRASLVERQALCREMVWMPARWSAGARVTWYGEFGYENFFLLMGLYPNHAIKLMEVGGAQGFCQGRLIARAVREGLYPHAVLLGEDICSQKGPMISPGFMERYYAPALRHGLQPLLEVGCKPVWHCDGDVRPLLDMLFDCGVQGLQGFQPECGMTIEYVATRRTREGRRLLIFGPLAVTTELPVCTPAEIRAKVRHAVEVCRGNADLVLFTGNTINPDVPLANIRAMYDAVLEG